MGERACRRWAATCCWIFIGYSFRDGRNPRLVYQHWLPPSRRVGWPVDVRVGLGVSSKSPRLRRPVRQSFAPKLDLNRPMHPPVVRPPRRMLRVIGARSDKVGCLATVEVEHVLETPQRWPRHAASHIAWAANGLSEFVQASQHVANAATCCRIRVEAFGRCENCSRICFPSSPSCPGQACPKSSRPIKTPFNTRKNNW